jgi:opacity protein-like surface antigen
VDIDNYERKQLVGGDTFIDGAKLKDGWAAGGALGTRWNTYVRTEFEFAVRDTSAETWFEQEFDDTGALVSDLSVPAAGTVRGYSGMFNILFDLTDTGLRRPYIHLGGGIGAIYLDSNFATATDTYEGIDTSFAYQAIGGVSFPVRKRVTLFTEYRYLGADYLNVRNVTTGESLGDFSYDSHSFFFGVRLGN